MEQDELERLVGGRLRLTLNEIVRHPRLPEARHAYLASFLKVYASQELALFGYVSDRQADHLIARLREVGFLELRRAPGDGRVQAKRRLRADDLRPAASA